MKKNQGFSKFKKKKFFKTFKLPWGHVMSYIKFGPYRFSRFVVYWIQKQTNRQTNKQTDRQAKFIYRLKRLNNILCRILHAK